MKRDFLPRQIHPFAWWGWALGLVAAASTTINPLFLLAIIAVAALVTMARRGDNPWARAFRLYLMLGVFIVVLRVAFRIVFGGGDGPTILFVLPQIPLPEWVRGIRLLGPVSLESLLNGLYDGLRLAAIIVCVGAANALADPKKLLASLPAALYEVGTVLIVAVSALPQLGESLQRVARARRLRAAPGGNGRRGRLRAIQTIIVPVLSDALERSLALAASMDVRGYGRVGQLSRRTRTTALVLGLACFGGLTFWTVRLLQGDSNGRRVLGLDINLTSLLVASLAAGALALRLLGGTVRRTQYRPIRWRLAEWLTLGSGVVVAWAITWIATEGDATALFPTISPFQWPTLTPPLLALLVIAALPAFVTPPPEVGAGSTAPVAARAKVPA